VYSIASGTGLLGLSQGKKEKKCARIRSIFRTEKGGGETFDKKDSTSKLSRSSTSMQWNEGGGRRMTVSVLVEGNVSKKKGARLGKRRLYRYRGVQSQESTKGGLARGVLGGRR